MREDLKGYVFRDSHFALSGNTLVCIAESLQSDASCRRKKFLGVQWIVRPTEDDHGRLTLVYGAERTRPGSGASFASPARSLPSIATLPWGAIGKTTALTISADE